jgi:hypothetical protein
MTVFPAVAIVAIERALLTAIWHMLTTAPTTKIPDPTTTQTQPCAITLTKAA